MTVVIIGTGGTIASTSSPSNTKIPTTAVQDLLTTFSLKNSTVSEVAIVTSNILSKDSASLNLTDYDLIRDSVCTALADPHCQGIVITHGTDTMEETAFLIDLTCSDSRPIVFTGAQRSADDPQTDGPGNLRAAIAVASSVGAHNLGVLISFSTTVFPARNTTKVHLSHIQGFSNPQIIGHVYDDNFQRNPVLTNTFIRKTLTPQKPFSENRVDIIACYPGVDRTAIDSYVSAGTKGIILQSMGSGNVNDSIVEAVKEYTDKGIVFLVSTRVPYGEVLPTYGGGGGGADLHSAGAIFVPQLRSHQARILLIALLASDTDIPEGVNEFGWT
ncbi:MAG: asparaginase [Mycobacteriaceae bacterium]